MRDGDLARFQAAVAAGLAHLESRREEVNDLNVFPVADGDTGDNMVLTLKAVLDELQRLQERYGTQSVVGPQRAEMVESVARAALLGARGNSGVILSQLIRGAAEELASRPGELVDATLIGAAIANAADKAYASVREPAEGTILTVAREMARMIASDVAHAPESPRLQADTEPQVQDAIIAQTLERAIAAGTEAVQRGPEMLAALREAGVVDAGGYGLTLIVAGVVAALRGQQAPELDHYAPAQISHPQHTSSRYRYCTNFAVTGKGLRPGAFIAPLERIGDSVLVVGDTLTLKVHIHTDEPERATAVFDGVGGISHLDVADMTVQVQQRDARIADARSSEAPSSAAATAALTAAAELAFVPAAGAGANGSRPQPAPDGSGEEPPAQARRTRCAIVAVASGEGMKRLFAELGANVVDGGVTLNPSTYELLAGIHEAPAEEVVILPCSRNVVMAAESAAKLSEKQIVVANAFSQQAGLAAAVACKHDASAEENAALVEAALRSLRTGAVAEAAKDDPEGRFSEGEALGLVDEEIVVWGEPSQTLLFVARRLADGAELLSVLAGADAPLALAEVESLLDDGFEAELEIEQAGQSAYWWLLAAE